MWPPKISIFSFQWMLNFLARNRVSSLFVRSLFALCWILVFSWGDWRFVYLLSKKPCKTEDSYIPPASFEDSCFSAASKTQWYRSIKCSASHKPAAGNNLHKMRSRTLMDMALPNKRPNSAGHTNDGKGGEMPCKRIRSAIVNRLPRFVTQWPAAALDLVKQGLQFNMPRPRLQAPSQSMTQGLSNGSSPLDRRCCNALMTLLCAVPCDTKGKSYHVGRRNRGSKKTSNGGWGNGLGKQKVPWSNSRKIPTK